VSKVSVCIGLVAKMSKSVIADTASGDMVGRRMMGHDAMISLFVSFAFFLGAESRLLCVLRGLFGASARLRLPPRIFRTMFCAD
jgi:hypothetical protein